MADPLTVAETATRLGLSHQRIRKLLQDCRFPGAVRNGTWLIPASAVEGFEKQPDGRPAIPEGERVNRSPISLDRLTELGAQVDADGELRVSRHYKREQRSRFKHGGGIEAGHNDEAQPNELNAERVKQLAADAAEARARFIKFGF